MQFIKIKIDTTFSLVFIYIAFQYRLLFCYRYTEILEKLQKKMSTSEVSNEQEFSFN